MSAAPAPPPLRVTVEFGGGLEVLFGGQKRLASLALPADVRTLGALVRWLAGPSDRITLNFYVDGEAAPSVSLLAYEACGAGFGAPDIALPWAWFCLWRLWLP